MTRNKSGWCKMTTIKEMLDALPISERKLLDYAFENGIGQYVMLPDNRFVGVNVGHLKHLKSDLSSGCWSAGVMDRYWEKRL